MGFQLHIRFFCSSQNVLWVYIITRERKIQRAANKSYLENYIDVWKSDNKKVELIKEKLIELFKTRSNESEDSKEQETCVSVNCGVR